MVIYELRSCACDCQIFGGAITQKFNYYLYILWILLFFAFLYLAEYQFEKEKTHNSTLSCISELLNEIVHCLQ